MEMRQGMQNEMNQKFEGGKEMKTSIDELIRGIVRDEMVNVLSRGIAAQELIAIQGEDGINIPEFENQPGTYKVEEGNIPLENSPKEIVSNDSEKVEADSDNQDNVAVNNEIFTGDLSQQTSNEEKQPDENVGAPQDQNVNPPVEETPKEIVLEDNSGSQEIVNDVNAAVQQPVDNNQATQEEIKVDETVVNNEATTVTASVIAVNALNDINVANGVAKEDIAFPTTVGVTLSDGTTSTKAVSNFVNDGYNGTVAGTYVFTGVVADTDLIATVNVIVAPVSQ